VEMVTLEMLSGENGDAGDIQADIYSRFIV
jgi:hypothetical protein